MVDGGGEVVGGGVVPPELPPQAAVSSIATSVAPAPDRGGIGGLYGAHPARFSRLKSGRESWSIPMAQLTACLRTGKRSDTPASLATHEQFDAG
jgi:hypothetical protein